MASGDKITRANMPTPGAESGVWDSSHEFIDPDTTYWISAPVWVVQFVVRSMNMQIITTGTIAIYKWDGSSGFTLVTQRALVSQNGRTEQYRFVHNCSENADERDNSNIHLWKFVVSSSGSGQKILSMRAGSVKSTVNSQPSTYAAGKKIRGCRPEIWNTGATYSSDSAFINGENPMARRGTKISWANGNYCYGEM